MSFMEETSGATRNLALRKLATIGHLLEKAKNLEFTLLLVSLVPVYYVLRMVFDAVFFPMDLEIREGVAWLYVLARDEGVNMYDHTRVAYYSNHGPTDPLIRSFVHFLLPFLPSQAVVRATVAAVPFCLFAMTVEAARGFGRWRYSIALLSLAAIYLGMANLRSYNMLVGRPDPTIICLSALQAMFTARFFYARTASIWSMVLYSLCMPFAFFAVFRIVPITGALWMIAAFCLAQGEGGRRRVSQFIAVNSAGFLIVYLFILFVSFMGNPHLFYAHFVGIPTEYMGYGQNGPWQLFPDEAMGDGTIRLAVLSPLVIMVALPSVAGMKRNSFYYLALLLSVAAYVTFSYAYNQNKSGAGLYYFSAYIFLTWFCVLLCASRIEGDRRAGAFAAGLLAYVLIVPGWSQVTLQIGRMEQTAGPVQNFRRQLEELDAKDEIMSETYHLYKNHLGHSLVDNGDGVEDMIKRSFFDEDFWDTGRRFFAEVRTGKYKYYLTGGLEAEQTKDYLKKNYRAIGTGPAYDHMNAPGGCVSVINCPMIWQKKE